MHAGDNQQRPDSAHDADGQEADLVLYEVDESGNAFADHDTRRANHQNTDGRRNEDDEHRLEEVLGNRRGDAVDKPFNVRENPGHAERGNDRMGVFDGGNGNTQEMGGCIAYRDGFHQRAEIRVEQDSGNRHGQVGVGVELFRSRSSHHDGQEIERRIADAVQNDVGVALCRQNAGHLQQHDHQFQHGGADDGRDQGRHGADNGIQNVVADFFRVRGSFFSPRAIWLPSPKLPIFRTSC